MAFSKMQALKIEAKQADDAITAQQAVCNDLADILDPYWGAKKHIKEQLLQIPFIIGWKTVDSEIFCGLSPQAREHLFKRTGEVLEPGFFKTITRRVGIRDPEHIAQRKVLFEQSIELDEEWGRTVVKWKEERRYLGELHRHRDRLLREIERTKKPIRDGLPFDDLDNQ